MCTFKRGKKGHSANANGNYFIDFTIFLTDLHGFMLAESTSFHFERWCRTFYEVCNYVKRRQHSPCLLQIKPFK